MNKKELLIRVEEIKNKCTGNCKKCNFGVESESKLFKHCVLEMWDDKNIKCNTHEGKYIADACHKACDEFLRNSNIKDIGCEGCYFCVLDENGYEKDCKLSL